MIILGLTGSIGMGKSTAAAMFRRMAIPVHDSDAAVHALLAPGGAAVTPVLARFPSVKNKQGGIDKAALGRLVFADPNERLALEAIIHPMVQAEQNKFLRACRAQRQPIVVLDIPLLFETGADKRVDYTVVVTAPAFIQRQRVVLKRGFDEKAFQARLNSQMPDTEKRRRADFIVQTGNGMAYTQRELKSIVRTLLQRPAP